MRNKIRNVVDVYSHIDAMDMPMWVVTYYDDKEGKFKVVEVVENTVELEYASEDIKKKFEEEKKKVEENDRRLAEKMDKVLGEGICILCGGKIHRIRKESFRRFLRLNRNKEGYYCPNCKTVWIHTKYPSPCHFSEELEALRKNTVIYRIFFDYYRSPLIPRLSEWKAEEI